VNNEVKNIKVLTRDLDNALYSMSEKGFFDFKEKLIAGLVKFLGLNLDQAKKIFNQRLKKLKGTTKTLNSFSLDGFKLIGKIQ